MMANKLLRFAVRHYPFQKGKRRLHDLAIKTVRGTTVEENGYGHRMLLDLDSFIDAHLYLDGFWDREHIQLLAQWADAQDDFYFLDIGANMGVYSTCFASHPGIKHVYAFEPDPRNFAQLQANLFLNNQFNLVTVHQLALSSDAGEAELFLTRDDATINTSRKTNPGTSSLVFFEGRHQEVSTYRVPVHKADDLIHLNSQNVLIKVDVEGHEFNALQGMREILSNNHCFLQVEVWRQAKEELEQIDTYLKALGYRESTPASFSHTQDHFYVNQPPCSGSK